MVAALLLLLMVPASALAWTLTDQCELARETEKGIVTISPSAANVLLYLPEGLAANGTSVSVSIGNKNWRANLVGGAVELEGGAKPFLEKNWATVRAGSDQAFGFNLAGVSEAWEKVQDCEPAVEGGGWIPLAGEITASSDDEVISAIRRQRPAGVLLDSTGGLAEEAQRIGQAVRAAGLATKVPTGGQCLSECTFILAAGMPRTIEENARVGIRAALITWGLGVFQGDHEKIVDSAAYFTAMGVDGGRVAKLALSAQNNEIRIFTPEELHQAEFMDSSAPEALPKTIKRRFSSTADVDWWLVGGLLGVFGLLGWGLTKLGRTG